MKISVCMATYNGGKFIREQMDSILNQDLSKYPDAELEVIVSDDKSSDDTIAILESYNDNRIKIFHHVSKHHHKYKKGLFAATENFSNAMSKATGDYIFLSDQDDVWYPQKVAKTIDVLIQKGGVCAASFDVGYNAQKKYGTEIYKKRARFSLKKFYYGFCFGFTKDFLRKYIIPIPDIPAHDMFITLLASFSNNISLIEEPCAIHRWTGEHNVSSHDTYSPFWYRNYYRIKMVLVAFYRCFLK